MKETDVLDIDISLIKLPFNNFYVDLSTAKIPFEENGNEFVEGAFIRDEYNDGEDYERAINIDFVGKAYIDKYWTINKDLCWDSERGFHSMLLFLDRKDNLKTIQDAITFDKDGFVGTALYDDRDDNTKIDLYLIHKQFVDRTINFIINCLLYLTTKDADIDEKYPDDLPFHLKSNLDKANTNRKKEIAKASSNQTKNDSRINISALADTFIINETFVFSSNDFNLIENLKINSEFSTSYNFSIFSKIFHPPLV